LDLRDSTYDEEGNLLDEKPIDTNEIDRRKKITIMRNIVENLIQKAKSSNEGLDFLVSNIRNIEASFDQIMPTAVQGIQEEYEGFIGRKIPGQIQIHPPTDVHSRGRMLSTLSSARCTSAGNRLRKESKLSLCNLIRLELEINFP
jgi:hypothetical protein